MMHCARILGRALLLAAFTPASIAFAVEVGQIDDFEDGTTMDWSEGFTSPNPPANVASGGPEGSGDNYLANVSDGSPNGPGGRMVMFNRVQWSGDYDAAGVNGLRVKMANFGNAPLSMRIAINSDGDQWGSAQAFPLPDDGQWYEHTFRLTAAHMAKISAFGTLEAALSNVDELRLLSASAGPSWRGDPIVGSLGIDDLTAEALPIAAEEATWGTVKSTFER